MKTPHLIVLSSDGERTEVRMNLTPDEAKLLARLAKSINRKANWSADVRMSLYEAPPKEGAA